jgi:hypothetical protein
MGAVRWQALALLAAAASVAAILIAFPPATHAFYPFCPLQRWAHIACPLCGMTRALAALLAGRVAEALHHNAFIVALVPFAIAAFAKALYTALRRNRWIVLIPSRIVTPLVLVAVGFGIARNFFPALLGP